MPASTIKLHVSHTYRVPPAVVYDAWLNPEIARRFLFATDDGHVIRADIDPHVGEASLKVEAVREIAPSVLVAHVKSTLNAPTGPLAGEHRSLFTMVLVQQNTEWQIAAFHNTLVQ